MIEALQELRRALVSEREDQSSRVAQLESENTALRIRLGDRDVDAADVQEALEHPTPTLTFDLSSFGELFGRMESSNVVRFGAFAASQPSNLVEAACGARLVDANPAALELLGVADFDGLRDHAGPIFGIALVETLSLFAGVVWRGERTFTHRLSLRTADGAPRDVVLSARTPNGSRCALGLVRLALTPRAEAPVMITPAAAAAAAATGEAARTVAKLLKLAGQAGVLKSKFAGQAKAERAGRLQRAILELILLLGEGQPLPSTVSNLSHLSIRRPLAAAVSARAAARAQVLLITDVAQARPAVSALLTSLGVAHETLALGDERLCADRVGEFDLILADVVSTDGDATAVARYVRGLGGVAAELPLVALTLRAGPEHRQGLLQAGYDRLLAKPLDTAALADEVRRWCGPAALAPEAAEQPTYNLTRQAA